MSFAILVRVVVIVTKVRTSYCVAAAVPGRQCPMHCPSRWAAGILLRHSGCQWHQLENRAVRAHRAGTLLRCRRCDVRVHRTGILLRCRRRAVRAHDRVFFLSYFKCACLACDNTSYTFGVFTILTRSHRVIPVACHIARSVPITANSSPQGQRYSWARQV